MRVSVVLVGALLAHSNAAAPAFSAPGGSKPSSGLQKSLGKCFADQNAIAPFSGVVVANDGKEEFLRTSGFSDASSKVPMRRDHRFHLASVGKILTRAAVGRLADEGRLDLDKPLTTYMPGLPPEFGAVTAQQLLLHRSGATTLTRPKRPDLALLYSATTATQLLPLVTREPLRFTPGEQQEYSNGGFILLGALIESITGKTFERYMKEAVLEPLGMHSTGFTSDSRTAVPMAVYSDDSTGALVKDTAPPEIVNRRGQPHGDIISTVDDLMKLAEAMTSPSFITPAVQTRVFQKRGDPPRLGQLGGTVGANTDLTVYPTRGAKFLLLSNFGPPEGEIMAEVLRGVLLGKACAPTSVEAWEASRAKKPSPSQATSGAAKPTASGTRP